DGSSISEWRGTSAIRTVVFLGLCLSIVAQAGTGVNPSRVVNGERGHTQKYETGNLTVGGDLCHRSFRPSAARGCCTNELFMYRFVPARGRLWAKVIVDLGGMSVLSRLAR